jgi:hypothetical protein
VTQHNPYSNEPDVRPDAAAPGNPYAPPAPSAAMPGLLPHAGPPQPAPELAAAIAAIQSLQRTSGILRMVAIGMIVASLVGSKVLPWPLLALLFLGRIVAWSVCGVLSLVIGRKVAALGQSASGHYVNAAVNFAVVAYLIVMTVNH